MNGRLWISNTGTELLGFDVLGTPLVADEDGIEPMTEITGVTSVTFKTARYVPPTSHEETDR